MQARADLYPIHAQDAQGQGRIRKEFEYVRNGTSTLIAAFNIQTGEVFGGCWRRTAAGIERFLEAIADKYPDGQVYIVWDNLNVHKGAAIEAFNDRHGGRFHFVYTPLHASWMNQVEILVQYPAASRPEARFVRFGRRSRGRRDELHP